MNVPYLFDKMEDKHAARLRYHYGQTLPLSQVRGFYAAISGYYAYLSLDRLLPYMCMLLAHVLLMLGRLSGPNSFGGKARIYFVGSRAFKTEMGRPRTTDWRVSLYKTGAARTRGQIKIVGQTVTLTGTPVARAVACVRAT